MMEGKVLNFKIYDECLSLSEEDIKEMAERLNNFSHLGTEIIPLNHYQIFSIECEEE